MYEFEDELTNLAYLSLFAGPPPDPLQNPSGGDSDNGTREVPQPGRLGGVMPPLTKYARQEREKVIAALKELGVRNEDLESIVGPEPPRLTVAKCPLPFKAPAFRVAEQTQEEWIRLVDAAWDRYRKKQIVEWGSLVNAGHELPFHARQQRKRKDKKDLRYKVAAMRLKGSSWDDIARACYPNDRTAREHERTVSRVKKAGNKVLDDSGLAHRVDHRRYQPAP